MNDLIAHMKKYYTETLMFITLFGMFITFHDYESSYTWLYAAYFALCIHIIRSIVTLLKNDEYTTTKWIASLRLVSSTCLIVSSLSLIIDNMGVWELIKEYSRSLNIVGIFFLIMEGILSMKRFKRQVDSN